MRFFVIFAAIVMALGVYVARSSDRIVGTRSPGVMAAAQDTHASPSASNNPNSVRVSADQLGHFHVDGRVDGRRLQFLVDTGASTIALTAASAAQLGIHPVPRDFTLQQRTANGTVRAAPVRLGMVEVGGILVRDVVAVVFPDESLSDNLLGMSFLSRLRRYEYANGRLVLEQ